MTTPWRPYNCALCNAPIGKKAPEALCSECIYVFYECGHTAVPLMSEDCRRDIRGMVGEAIKVAQRLAHEREEEGPADYIKVAATEVPCYLHPDDVVKVEVTNAQTGRNSVLVECAARNWPQFMVTWGFHVRMRLREQEQAALVAASQSTNPALAHVAQQAQAGLRSVAVRMGGALIGSLLAEAAVRAIEGTPVTATPPEDPES